MKSVQAQQVTFKIRDKRRRSELYCTGILQAILAKPISKQLPPREPVNPSMSDFEPCELCRTQRPFAKRPCAIWNFHSMSMPPFSVGQEISRNLMLTGYTPLHIPQLYSDVTC